MACASDRDARVAGTLFTLIQIVVRSLLWLPIAIALLVIFPFDPNTALTDAVISERETVFARGMDELLPTGIRGLMITGCSRHWPQPSTPTSTGARAIGATTCIGSVVARVTAGGKRDPAVRAPLSAKLTVFVKIYTPNNAPFAT